MTLPDERIRAVMQARDLLFDLCNPGYRPRWKELRARARGVLKHFPGASDHDYWDDEIEEE